MDVQIHLLVGSFVILFLAIYLVITQNVANLPNVASLLKSRGKQHRKDERRIFPRFKTMLRIKYGTPLEEGISWVKDIGRGGMRLFLNTIKVGTAMSLEITLPGETKPIFAQGDVIWSRGSDSGLSFGSVEQGDVSKILEYGRMKSSFSKNLAHSK